MPKLLSRSKHEEFESNSSLQIRSQKERRAKNEEKWSIAKFASCSTFDLSNKHYSSCSPCSPAFHAFVVFVAIFGFFSHFILVIAFSFSFFFFVTSLALSCI